MSLIGFGKNRNGELNSSHCRGDRTMQALKFFSVNEQESDVFDHIRDLAKKALSSDDIQDTIKFYDFLAPLMSDFLVDRPHEEYMEFNNKRIESPENRVYSLGRVEEILVDLANGFPFGMNVEFGTWFTGSTNELLDQFVAPRVIGITSVAGHAGIKSIVEYLTENINRHTSTLETLALHHTIDGETRIGILLDALFTYTGREHILPSDDGNCFSTRSNLFIDSKNLIFPVGMALSDYLSPHGRELLQLGGNENPSAEDLTEQLLSSKNIVKTSIRTGTSTGEKWHKYTLLQERESTTGSFDIDAYGTPFSWHPTNSYYEKVLRTNKFAISESGRKNGAFMSIHLHNAYSQQEIDTANRNGTALNILLDAVGREEIHTFPTPSDILHDSYISTSLEKIDLYAANVGNLILSLTDFDKNQAI